MKKVTLVLLIPLLLFFFAGYAAATGTGNQDQSDTVTLKLNNKPFGEVAGELNKQTGYTIIFDEKWNTLPISGYYNDVTLEEFFRRVFRKQNTSLLIDSSDKLLIVRFFGDKSFEDLLSGAMVAGKGPGNQDQIPDEIRELHRQQHQELKAYLDDPESVDPLSGMKLVDIRALHEEQEEQLKRDLENPDTVDPVSGATLGEIEKLHASQRDEVDKFRNNPGNVEPDSGMTVKQIQELHAAQRAELQRMLSDPNTVDPTSGMKLSEIWERSKKTGN